MLCSLALLSVMVVAAFGAGAGGPPPLCCMPDQFRVTNVYANTNVGKAGVSHHMVRSVSAYDFVNHQEVYYTTRNYPNGSQEQLDYYLDYPENRMYVFNNQTGECIKARMNKQHGKRCVPGFSTVTDAHFTYGAGQDSIPAYRAIFFSPRLDGNTLYTAMTVGPNCIPVVVKLTIFPWGAGGTDTLILTLP
ncbi:hypothetical protein ACOMHN_037945 [Nucella lapillus]